MSLEARLEPVPSQELGSPGSLMQLSNVDGERVQAFPGGKGTCPMCGATTIAKCGPRIKHHWAHVGRRNCDPWWESETDWHRAWKNLFPEAWREVSLTAPDGEIHRADIITPYGIVIEVQHSAMTDEERLSRERFYGNLVWVVDGRPFRDNFDVYHHLPAPASEVAADLVWIKARRHLHGANAGLFLRLSEYRLDHPQASKAEVRSGEIHGIRKVEPEVSHAYRGHHQYDWVHPRRTWLDATCPVYIDLGGEHLLKLEVYDESGLPCVRYVAKKKFILDAMHEQRAADIAERFFPLPPDSTSG